MKSNRKAAHLDPHGSPPSRGAWIEISEALKLAGDYDVAPLAGGVD